VVALYGSDALRQCHSTAVMLCGSVTVTHCGGDAVRQ